MQSKLFLAIMASFRLPLLIISMVSDRFNGLTNVPYNFMVPLHFVQLHWRAFRRCQVHEGVPSPHECSPSPPPNWGGVGGVSPPQETLYIIIGCCDLWPQRTVAVSSRQSKFFKESQDNLVTVCAPEEEEEEE